MANYYKYDPDTGAYLGAVPASGNPDAMPPDNTTRKAPDLTPGQWPIWHGESWRYVEDYRNQIAWAKNLSGVLAIQELGPVPVGYTLKQPPPIEDGFTVSYDDEQDDWIRVQRPPEYDAWRKSDAARVTVNDTAELPDDITLNPPPEQRLGYAVQWKAADDEWEYTPDYRGLGGFVDGEWTVIDELGPLPAKWSDTKPLPPKGHVTEWNREKAAWEFVEDHRGESGYVNGEYTSITELGPLPDGWSIEPPQPEPEPLDPTTARLYAIDTELKKIDQAWIRPARAVMADTATPDDAALVVALEQMAQELREERESLVATQETANA